MVDAAEAATARAADAGAMAQGADDDPSRRVNLRELGLSALEKFSGSKTSLPAKTFLIRFEHVASVKNWSDSQKAQLVQACCSGPAKNWVDIAQQLTQPWVFSYAMFKVKFLRRWHVKPTFAEKAAAREQLKQRATEDPRDFFDRCILVETLLDDGERENETLTYRQARENSALINFVCGCDKQVKRRIVLERAKTMEQVEDAIALAVEEDRVRIGDKNLNRLTRGYDVGMVQWGGVEDTGEDGGGEQEIDGVRICAAGTSQRRQQGARRRAGGRRGGGAGGTANSRRSLQIRYLAEQRCFGCGDQGHFRAECPHSRGQSGFGAVGTPRPSPFGGPPPRGGRPGRGRGRGGATRPPRMAALQTWGNGQPRDLPWQPQPSEEWNLAPEDEDDWDVHPEGQMYPVEAYMTAPPGKYRQTPQHRTMTPQWPPPTVQAPFPTRPRVELGPGNPPPKVAVGAATQSQEDAAKMYQLFPALE